VIDTPIAGGTTPTGPTSRNRLFSELQRAISQGLQPTQPSISPTASPSGYSTTSFTFPGGAGGHPDRLFTTNTAFDRFLLDMQLDIRLSLLQSYLQRRLASRTRAGTGSSESSPPSTLGGNASSLSSPLTSILPLLSAGIAASRPANSPVRGNGSGLDERGGITWWRSFRFPPMERPSVLVTRNTDDSVSQGSTLDSLSASASSQGDSHLPSNSPPQPTAAPDDQLVPVILVGLQSVESTEIAAAANQTTPGNNDTTGARPGGQREIARQLADILQLNSTAASPNAEQPQVTTNLDGQTYMIFVLGGESLFLSII
jgi:hypothetical protein